MKLTIKAGIAALLVLFVFSCTKEPKNISSSAIVKTQESTAIQSGVHYIGERFGGGIVFWVSHNKLHGLISDTVDAGLYRWYNGTNSITGALETAIGTGKANTKKIILSQGIAPGRYAALRCANYKASGYTDWFLPSLDELNELYKQSNVVGGFASGYYWSSSEIINDYAWAVYFVNGAQLNLLKYSTTCVRAVRAF